MSNRRRLIALAAASLLTLASGPCSDDPLQQFAPVQLDLPPRVWVVTDHEGNRTEFTTQAAAREELAKAQARYQDALEDMIDSLATAVAVSLMQDIADMVSGAGLVLNGTPSVFAFWFNNSEYECGVTRDDGVFTVCPDGAGNVPAGEIVHLTTTLAAPVPAADPTQSLIYAAVFESDDDPANDWQYVEPFVQDFFQGADRWYQLAWDHASGSWTLRVTQVGEDQSQNAVASNARVVIDGEQIHWYIPRNELPSARPTFQLTAFVHDGSFGESTRAGDVIGGVPTSTLFDLPDTTVSLDLVENPVTSPSPGG